MNQLIVQSLEKILQKIYHRQGDQLNQSDQNIEFIFGENNNYHQIGNAYLEFNFIVGKKMVQFFNMVILSV